MNKNPNYKKYAHTEDNAKHNAKHDKDRIQIEEEIRKELKFYVETYW